ncbi:hypothetical protein QVD17_28118 [Tagetes erecta]|uniref:Uncharacterized protein n=1 Tax=Tagetes erecta TaxID=13708 RepID=A0AAD8KA68_TARER|nr:hypothetical protein QVD17_28118 [Tagetes erecta]
MVASCRLGEHNLITCATYSVKRIFFFNYKGVKLETYNMKQYTICKLRIKELNTIHIFQQSNRFCSF